MNENTLRFPLRGTEACQAHSPDQLLRLHLEALLDLLVPTQDGRELHADGYKLLSDRQTIHSLRSDTTPVVGVTPRRDGHPSAHIGTSQQLRDYPDTLDLYEPRISYIRRLLESLFCLVELEADGQPVRIDGFRLRNPNQWLAPGGGAEDILAHAASRCNLSCRFCYNGGAPATLKHTPRSPHLEFEEIRTRIEHYVPQGKLNLFPTAGSPGEMLAHPHILNILTALREKTREVIRISTNGAALTPDMVRALARLKPVYVDVSLNSASPERRTWLMNDPSPMTAINSLSLLREEKIPFTVVIVPWPFPSQKEMLDDLESTAAFAAGFDPVLIQVSLPGYTRAMPEDTWFSAEEVWNRLERACQHIRERIDCPLLMRPGLFEEYETPGLCNDPLVLGAVKSSPAAKAGLRQGDRIKKINGLPVKSRPQARALLNALRHSDLNTCSLSIERDGIVKELKLDRSQFDYPYTPETATHLGVVFASSGIPREWAERVRDVIAAHHAKDALLMTSTLVRPTLEKLVAENGMPSGVRLHFCVPRNEFFGGNIFMGDLIVVEDFISAAQGFVKQRKIRPDLILVPSSPFRISGWGRDLTGRPYLDIERALKIPVALVECDTIFD